MLFTQENNALIAKRQGETLRIETWGKDSFRVRSTMYPEFTGRDWALTEDADKPAPVIKTGEDENGICAEIVNGRIKATVNSAGVISFYRDD